MAHLKKSKTKRTLFSSKPMLAFVILLSIIALVLIVLLLVQTGVMNNPLNIFTKRAVSFSINDVCSLIVGNIIHPIPTEDACAGNCRASCEVREKGFVKSEFVKNENDCNTCQCYCK